MRISDCSSDVCSSDRAALAARALGNENARTIDAGGMELDELHVLQRKARAQHHAAAVAGAGMGGRRRKIGTARTAGRKDHGVRADRQSVVEGKSVSGPEELGGGRSIKKKTRVKE